MCPQLPAYLFALLALLPRPGPCQPAPPPGAATENPPRALTFEEKEALRSEALLALVPRGGHWTITYQNRDRMDLGELPVWDSDEPDKWAWSADVPCWLPTLITVRATGLVDGHGNLYTGPLLAQANDYEFTGPYPEGFLCAIDGALEFTLCPKRSVFTQWATPVGVVYRLPGWFPRFRIRIGDELWPPTGGVEGPPPQRTTEELGVWSAPLALAGVCHDEKAPGFRMTPVTCTVVGDERVILAEAFYAMKGGRPAWKLPVRFEWELEPAGDLPRWHIENEDETDPNGRAANAIRVPRGYTQGSIRFWYHEVSPDFLPASGQSFDFGKPG